MKKIIIALFIGMTVHGYSQDNPDSRFNLVTKENIKEVLDTFNYSKADFELMTNDMNTDTTFLHNLERKILQGDTNAVKFKNLLNSTFENRFDTKVTDEEIKGLVFTYYLTRKLVMRFKELDDSLKKVE